MPPSDPINAAGLRGKTGYAQSGHEGKFCTPWGVIRMKTKGQSDASTVLTVAMLQMISGFGFLARCTPPLNSDWRTSLKAALEPLKS
jgi:hypothetical protein